MPAARRLLLIALGACTLAVAAAATADKAIEVPRIHAVLDDFHAAAAVPDLLLDD